MTDYQIQKEYERLVKEQEECKRAREENDEEEDCKVELAQIGT